MVIDANARRAVAVSARPRLDSGTDTDVASLQVEVVVIDGASTVGKLDWLAVEEPLEIRIRGVGREKPSKIAVTMRTPGHDDELAVGFLHSEGLLNDRANLRSVGPCRVRTGAKPVCNVVLVDLDQAFDESALKRNFAATSSCGLCGKVALEQLAVRCPAVDSSMAVSRSTIVNLPATLREAQAAFERTGGLHAAGLFDSEGRLQVLREDVGRHNAVDKVIGRRFLDGAIPLSSTILLVSGRTSFEILQKAAVAGIPIVAAVSAPSSMAVRMAKRLGITLIGFLRGCGFNIYSHPERIG